uniref:Secreted protein n=1 Tax=Colobus angolensis palliatus TaxID=336983 RepID=A0A2K5JDT2_COLAP
CPLFLLRLLSCCLNSVEWCGESIRRGGRSRGSPRCTLLGTITNPTYYSRNFLPSDTMFPITRTLTPPSFKHSLAYTLNFILTCDQNHSVHLLTHLPTVFFVILTHIQSLTFSLGWPWEERGKAHPGTKTIKLFRKLPRSITHHWSTSSALPTHLLNVRH